MTHTKQSLIAALKTRREDATGHRRLALNEALSLAQQLNENVGVDENEIKQKLHNIVNHTPMYVMVDEIYKVLHPYLRPNPLTFLDSESVVEEVARAMWETTNAHNNKNKCQYCIKHEAWSDLEENVHKCYKEWSQAAIATIKRLAQTKGD